MSCHSAMSCIDTICIGLLYTLNSVYNEKKYVENLLHYRWLFIKGDLFIGEWGIFGVDIFLHFSRFFIKGDFVIGRVECTSYVLLGIIANLHLLLICCYYILQVSVFEELVPQVLLSCDGYHPYMTTVSGDQLSSLGHL